MVLPSSSFLPTLKTDICCTVACVLLFRNNSLLQSMSWRFPASDQSATDRATTLSRPDPGQHSWKVTNAHYTSSTRHRGGVCAGLRSLSKRPYFLKIDLKYRLLMMYFMGRALTSKLIIVTEFGLQSAKLIFKL